MIRCAPVIRCLAQPTKNLKIMPMPPKTVREPAQQPAGADYDEINDSELGKLIEIAKPKRGRPPAFN